ncbi:MAG: type II secretion system F family protein [Puniceicoccales bacterium]|jgi:type IV pilus assembly protein PilC|nr:type II secretion system F family protein [Puniceicoccales bacterium]
MRFRFLGEKAGGEAIQGEIISDSRTSAVEELGAGGIKVQLLQSCPAAHRKKSWIAEITNCLFRKNKVKAQWKCDFFDQLAMLLSSGLPVEQCLSTLSTGRKDERTNFAIVQTLREKIAAGMSLSEGMTCCRGAFSDTEVKTIKAAEGIGRPEVALEKLSEFGKKMLSTKKKIKSALIYPAVVLVVAGMALILLMTVIVPKFEAILISQRSGGQKLPQLTQKVINLCNFFSQHLTGIAVFILLLGITVKILLTRKFFRRNISALCAKFPIFGRLLLAINLNNFFHTIGMLMSFGIPLQEALKLSMDVLGDGTVKKSFERISNQIACGETLSNSFRGNKLLASTDIGLIYAGEQSGNLAKSFSKMAEIYDRKIGDRLMLLATLIEPIIILFLAIIVGTIVVAIFLPMINLMQNIHP